MGRLILVALVLAACGGPSYSNVMVPGYPPRGGYAISCDKMADCWAVATHLCPNGYEVVGPTIAPQPSRTTTAMVSQPSQPPQWGVARHGGADGELLVTCYVRVRPIDPWAEKLR